MSKTTSINLGDHFESFIDQQIASGRYGSVSEVVRASLRLLEEREHKIEGLRRALIDGERSVCVGLQSSGCKSSCALPSKNDSEYKLEMLRADLMTSWTTSQGSAFTASR